MIAYKFLRTSRIGPFSGVPWPEPGVWVRAQRGVHPCTHGIHACTVPDLPWWLADELWEIELAGDVRREEHKIVAPAGRLRTRVEAWTAPCAQDYAEACAWRARDHAATALRRAHHDGAASQLERCETLDDLLSASRRLAEEMPDTRINLTIAGDGAFRALTGAPPTAAYIAAHAALRVGGAAGYAAERAWQSGWLAERLGLRDARIQARSA